MCRRLRVIEAADAGLAVQITVRSTAAFSPCPVCGGHSFRVHSRYHRLLNGVDPLAWFTDVLTKLAAGHPITKLDELLPWAYHRQAKTAVA